MKSFSLQQHYSLLRYTSPVFDIPGIGRRTSALLHAAGVKTVAEFVALPDLLLESTFGPSLPRLRRKVTLSLAANSQRVQSARSNIVRSLTSIFL